MLVVPQDFRAPLFVPGRRNRRVHWNRPLSRAIAMLGRFEREDYYRGSIRPWSLRQFFPAWNNQFSPGGGSGCGCCDGGPDPCTGIEDCFGGTLPSEAEVDLSPFSNTGHSDCIYCADLEATWILPLTFSSATGAIFDYTENPTAFVCDPATNSLIIELITNCVTDACEAYGKVQINFAGGFDLQASYYNRAGIGGGPVNFYNYSSLPWSLPYMGEYFPGFDSICSTSAPFIVQGFA
jgi:hypothetical protein